MPKKEASAMKKRFWILIGLLLSLTALSAAWGMSSPSYVISPSTTNSGGGSRSASGGHSITFDAIGEISGSSSSTGSLSAGIVPAASSSETTPPSSTIIAPAEGAALSGVSYTITGTATDGTGSGIGKVEVGIVPSAGATVWYAATGTESWSYNWTLPVEGGFTIKSRATDNEENIESPGAGVGVTVTAYGSPEVQHYNWDATTGGGDCAYCHMSVSRFLSADYGNSPSFCGSCHNASGNAHDKALYGSGHRMMANITAAGRMPSYGNVTAGEYNNQPSSRLSGGSLVTCITCHNVMRKPEDYGRTWEYTTTSDRYIYSLQRGGWSAYGYMAPRVYRDTSLWTGPTYSKSKKAYLVSPAEYTYNENAGTVTFSAQQPSGVFIYASLDYPFLRVSTQDNRLCSDCHTQTTHKGNNCLNCHQAHNTGNIKGVRGVIRTTDLSEQTVVFRRLTGMNSFADGDENRDGVCEVCHIQTKYYTRDGSGFANHSGGVNYDKKNCTACHSHMSGFAK